MAGIELCKFTHGLGLYIRILSRAKWRSIFYRYSWEALDGSLLHKHVETTWRVVEDNLYPLEFTLFVEPSTNLDNYVFILPIALSYMIFNTVTWDIIKPFDVSTLYTTIPHMLLKSRIKELIQRCFSWKLELKVWTNFLSLFLRSPWRKSSS
jgi:hypothetical protein